MVVYMCSRLLHLVVESRNLFQDENDKILFVLDEQILKMTTVFTQNGPGFKKVFILSEYAQLEKNHMIHQPTTAD
jgi:hypothetical protein